jgi:O-antigen ligase
MSAAYHPSRRGHSLRLDGAGPVTASVLSCICLAWLVAQGRYKYAAVLLVLVPLAAFVLERQRNGLLLGLGLIILVPWWVTFGSQAAKVGIVAPLLATAGAVAPLFVLEYERPSLNFIDLAFVAFVTAAAVSWVLTGPYSHNSITAIILLLAPCGFYVAARRLGDAGWRATCWVVVAGGALASLPLFYETLVIRRPLFWSASSYAWSAGPGGLFRPAGSFGGPPAAVNVLAMTTLCGLALFVRSTRSARPLILTLLLVSSAGMVITFTRAGLIGFFIGAIIFVILWRPAILGRLAFGLAAVGVVFALVVLPAVGAKTWYREGVTRSGTFANRQARWVLAWPVITNTPKHVVFGHGINSLLVGHPEGLSGNPQADLAAVPILVTDSPHSQYIRTLLEQGFFGLGLLLVWLLGTIVKALKAVPRVRPEDRAVLAGSVAGIVSFLVVALVDDNLRDPAGFAIVALLSGFVAARTRQAGRPTAPPETH